MTDDRGQQKTGGRIGEGGQDSRQTARIETFRDLRVYQLALELQQEVFERSKFFPKEEIYSLTDQIRRASRSIGANIAEAWQKRRYEAHFISKLSDADGEQAETQHWLDSSYACGYLSEDEHRKMTSKCKEIGRMLGTMLLNPGPFCRQFK
jgi:four helix bundle protein